VTAEAAAGGVVVVLTPVVVLINSPLSLSLREREPRSGG
jgi:hypothetical protein